MKSQKISGYNIFDNGKLHLKPFWRKKVCEIISQGDIHPNTKERKIIQKKYQKQLKTPKKLLKKSSKY